MGIVAGAAISFGVSALGRALTPTQYVYNKQENGKLDNLNTRKAGQGWPLNRYYGKDIITGCPVFWAIPRVDRPEVTTNSQRSGGKGGGGGGTVTTTETVEHRYYGTFAIAIGDGYPDGIDDIIQIIFNDEIWYNTEGNTTGTAANNDYKLANHLEIYKGTANQGVSPTIASYDDTAKIHFPYLVYIVVKDLPLASFGNDLPSTIDVVVRGKKKKLNEVIYDVSGLIGLNQTAHVLAEELNSIDIIGATFKQDGSSVKSFIDELLQIHFAQSYLDDDGVLNFVPQQNDDAAIAIDYEDLGAVTYDSDTIEPFQETIIKAETLPSSVSIDFKNINDNFSSGSASHRKQFLDHIKSESISTSLPLTPDTGASFCQKYLNLLWEQRNRFTISVLPEKTLLLRSAKKLSFPLTKGGSGITFIVTELQIGADLMGEVSLIPYKGEIFSSTPSVPRSTTVTYTGSVIQLTPNITSTPVIYAGSTLLVEDTDYTVNYVTGAITPITVSSGTELTIDYASESNNTVTPKPNEIPSYGEPVTTILDINRVNSGDPPCLYLVIEPDPTLDESFGDTAIYSRLNGSSYAQVGSAIAATTTGTLSGSLPLATELDTVNTFTVVLDRNSLNNLTTDEFNNNEQILLINDEQIVVKNAVLTAPLTYECDYLKRGHNGTIPASHSNGAKVTILRGDSPVIRLNGDSSLIGQTIDVKAVPVGSNIDTITEVSSLTVTGNYFKPYAGTNAIATKNQGNDITLSWTANHTGLLALNPLSFEVDIMDGVSVVRTLSSTVSSVSYSASQQIADFGSIQSSYTVRIYQLSLEYGRGYVYEALITPTLVNIVPTITAFSPTQGRIGDEITIFGSGFTGSTNAAINSVSLDSLVIVNDGRITGAIAATTTTGKITVTNAAGSGESLADFVILSAVGDVEWGDIGGNAGDNPALEYELLKLFWIKS